jgi:DNA-binding winged helix-turn-helix (wHTH) protein/tetratricopeptide (TPR) repeat protein
MTDPGALRGGRHRFGVFEFDEQTLELTRDGRAVALRLQALKVLALLLARPGDLVSRDDLRRALWDDDTFVDFEQGLNHAIRELRAGLGDSADSPRFVQTLPRRGYRFIATVQKVGEPDVVPVAPTAPSVSSPPIAAAEPTPHVATGTRFRWIVAGGLAVVALALVYAGVQQWGEAAGLPGSGGLAVRPFESPADPAFGVGLANAISARLGGQQAVSVRSLPSDAREWPDGVTHALDGDVVVNGPDVQVVARLRDRAGTIAWSERIRVRSDELFSLENVIAERVAAALRLRFAAAEQDRLRRRYTANAQAYADYLRGRAALVKYTPDGTLAAVHAFEAALHRDPRYALARAGLAMACADMYLRFAGPADVERWGERAEAEARAALALSADLAEAHLARAAVARKREFDWNATLVEGRRALMLNPNLDQARFFSAAAYYHNGYMEEALIEMEKGRGLHGLDAVDPVRIDALVALFSGHFAPARVKLEEVSRLSSQPIGDTYLALAYYYSGSAERGRSMLESLIESRSASTAARAGAALAGVLAAEHAPKAARDHLVRVLALGYRDHHVAYSLGTAYAQLGAPDDAYRWLRVAADTGFPCLPFFERDPLLEPLRRHAQFPELLAYVRARRDAVFDGLPPS